MISRLRYTLREMWASLTRNLTLTVAAVITSMVSLFLFGMTLLIQQAFDNQLSQWTGGVKMIVYVNNGAPDTAIATIEQALKSPTVAIDLRGNGGGSDAMGAWLAARRLGERVDHDHRVAAARTVGLCRGPGRGGGAASIDVVIEHERRAAAGGRVPSPWCGGLSRASRHR